GGAGGKHTQTVVVGAVPRSDAEPAVADDLQLDDLVLDQRRLVHLGAGEAGHPRALALDERLGLVALGRAQCACCQVEGAHDLKPTWTLRSRAGEAPCETCACCPGWPLPQLISHAICVPNWKLSRLSSIDQLLLVWRKTPSSTPAISSSSDPSPGSRWRFVIRTSGMRLQLSARIDPPEPLPIRAAVSREVRKPLRMPPPTTGSRAAATPSSSKPKVPRPPGVV